MGCLSDAKLTKLAMDFYDQDETSGDVALAVEFGKLVLTEDARRADQEARMATCWQNGHRIRLTSGDQSIVLEADQASTILGTHHSNLGSCRNCGAVLKLEREQW